MRVHWAWVALALFATPAMAQTPSPPPADRDWAAATVAGAHAFHDALQGSHPGPLDTQNPAFQRLLDDGLARAIERARRVRDFPGFVWTMREYAASFDDGHVSVGMPSNPTLPSRWPGFLVRYSPQGKYVVSSREATASAPPLGASLVSCDGVRADALALRRVGRVRGNWALQASRSGNAWRLFVDQGDPFAAVPRRCRFQADGRTRTYTLNWAPIAEATLAPYRTQSQQRYAGVFGVRRFAANNAAWWVSMPNFDATGGSDNARQLADIVRQLEAAGPELRSAPLVVLDIRGNTGGSSAWSVAIANAIWGEDQVAPRDPPGGYVEWRVSDGNIAHIQRLLDRWANDANVPASSREWGEEVRAGLSSARDAGQALWRQGEPRPMPAPLPPPQGPRVVVVADSGCGSACLDALDIWRAMGATQVGVTTSADTVYMEIRREPLPSGIMDVAIPMKVYRERPRGHNEPYQPHVRYEGDLTDTPTLEAWISALP